MRLITSLVFGVALCLALHPVAATAGELLNINTASAEDLMSLPHIGKAIAERIVNYRTDNGPFLVPHDLTLVSGVSEAVFAEIEPLITTGLGRVAAAGSAPVGGSISTAPAEVVPTVSPDEILAKFNHEPDIREIQAAAERFADIYPERVAKWWASVKRRALLPETRIVVDHDTESDRYRMRKTKTNYSDDTLTILPDEITTRRDTDDDWSLQLTMTWDLQDLIFNDDMLDVADQSEDIYKLRRDVLDDVTKMYYERRRLQVAMAMQQGKSTEERVRDELKLRELTAAIDALTGNYLSDNISRAGK